MNSPRIPFDNDSKRMILIEPLGHYPRTICFAKHDHSRMLSKPDLTVRGPRFPARAGHPACPCPDRSPREKTIWDGSEAAELGLLDQA